MILDFIRMSWRGIKTRKARSTLTVLGIVIGVAAVVALIAIAQGMQATMEREFEAIGYDTVFLIPGEAPQGMQAMPDRMRRLAFFGGGSEGAVLDLSRLKGLPQVEAVGAIRTETAIITAPGLEGQGFLRVTGLSSGITQGFPSYFSGFSLAGGRGFGEGDEFAVILGPKVAEDFGVSVGDRITIENKEVEVIGILEESEDGGMQRGLPGDPNYGIYLPIAAVDSLFGEPGKVSLALVKAAEGADVKRVSQLVEQAMATAGTPVTTTTVQEMAEMATRMLSSVQAVLAAIAAISLLVGAIGIMNTMYTAVLERVREIGIMKAVGAKKKHILSLFLLESGLVGLIGGVLGVIVGVALASVAGRLISGSMNVGPMAGGFSFSAVFPAELIVGALALSFGLGALAGVWPAQRAARLSPVEALRYE
ncbi:ABC transporter permease [Candidatus Bipolaricaulota bacterium]|nr:ABC transporter permease [Candidatus Bipolaricaulota bacterium]